MSETGKFEYEVNDLARRLHTWPKDCYAIFKNRNGTINKIKSQNEEMPRVFITHDQWVKLRQEQKQRGWY